MEQPVLHLSLRPFNLNYTFGRGTRESNPEAAWRYSVTIKTATHFSALILFRTILRFANASVEPAARWPWRRAWGLRWPRSPSLRFRRTGLITLWARRRFTGSITHRPNNRCNGSSPVTASRPFSMRIQRSGPTAPDSGAERAAHGRTK